MARPGGFIWTPGPARNAAPESYVKICRVYLYIESVGGDQHSAGIDFKSLAVYQEGKMLIAWLGFSIEFLISNLKLC